MDSELLNVWSGRADQDSIRAVSRLFELSGNPKSDALLYWQYCQHLGGSYLAIAYDHRGLIEGAAAMYAAFPVVFEIEGRREILVQSFDTLTLPDFRGRGLFQELANVVYAAATEDGVAGVYGFPNALSAPGFFQKLAWSSLDPLPLMVRPFGSRYARVRLRLRSPRIICRPRYTSPLMVNLSDLSPDLFVSTSSGCRLRIDWEYLKWRLTRPDSTYRIFAVQGEDGFLKALGITELTVKHGCSLGYVLNVLYSYEDKKAALHLTNEMIKDLRLRGCDLALAWSMDTQPSYKILRRRGFIKVPKWARPISLHFGARAFQQEFESVFSDRATWAISYFDSDTV